MCLKNEAVCSAAEERMKKLAVEAMNVAIVSLLCSILIQCRMSAKAFNTFMFKCVHLSRFENDRTISFIPPDGSFDVMTYRLGTQVKPLIWVEAQVERHSRSRIENVVKAKSQFKERSTATNVEIELPVPSDATNPNVRTLMGSASYAPESDSLIWKIYSFPGGKPTPLHITVKEYISPEKFSFWKEYGESIGHEDANGHEADDESDD